MRLGKNSFSTSCSTCSGRLGVTFDNTGKSTESRDNSFSLVAYPLFLLIGFDESLFKDVNSASILRAFPQFDLFFFIEKIMSVPLANNVLHPEVDYKCLGYERCFINAVDDRFVIEVLTETMAVGTLHFDRLNVLLPPIKEMKIFARLTYPATPLSSPGYGKSS